MLTIEIVASSVILQTKRFLKLTDPNSLNERDFCRQSGAFRFSEIAYSLTASAWKSLYLQS